MILITWEFFELPPTVDIPASMPQYYVLFLVLLSVVRASARWAHRKLPQKKGEYFVIAWGVYALVLHMFSAFAISRPIPTEVTTNLYFVGVVFFGTRIEKRFFLQRERNQRMSRTSRGKSHATRAS